MHFGPAAMRAEGKLDHGRLGCLRPGKKTFLSRPGQTFGSGIGVHSDGSRTSGFGVRGLHLPRTRIGQCQQQMCAL